MSFDPNLYAALAGNPAAQASYLAQFSAPAAAPVAPVPQAQPQFSAALQPGGGGGQFYQNPAAVQAPAPQLANGTLEDFYNQPTGSGGGPSVTSKFFTKRQQGSWLQLEVIADVTNNDVRQQTTPQGIPQTYKDGRPKFVLVVKVKVLGSSDGTHLTEFPDGIGSIWVKGVLADELRRSMAAAGDPSGFPKGGATIVMVSAGEQASRTPGFSATKLYSLQYAPPSSDLQAVAQAANPMAPPIPDVPAVIPSSPVPSVPPMTPSVMNLAAPPTMPSAPAAAPTSAVPAPPQAGETKEQLLARLHGQQ